MNNLKELPKRFLDKVNKTEYCWLWTAAKNDRGYGFYRLPNKQIKAHRFCWEYFNGEITKGLCVLHKCDTPSCVNPDHLFLGTYQDNTDDRAKKDRIFKGEQHPNAKLSADEVNEIRKTYKRGTNGDFSQKGLAIKYGVSNQLISEIINGKKWAV